MNKLFVLLCLALLITPMAAFARTVSAYNQYYSFLPTVSRTYERYQVVRIGGTAFTRQIDGVRHTLAVSKIDDKTRKVIFEDRIKGKPSIIEATYDTNNLGMLKIGSKSYKFQVDIKRRAVSIGYGTGVYT